MRKNDIVDHIVNTTALSRSKAIEAVDEVFEAIAQSLSKGDCVFIRGFATIKVYDTPERKARNISKGTTVIVPARRMVKLVASKQLKERINS